MSIASVTGFVTASLVLVGLVLGLLVVSVGVATFQFFAENRPVRVARQEPLVRHYRQVAFG